jgi:hypothetical protein
MVEHDQSEERSMISCDKKGGVQREGKGVSDRKRVCFVEKIAQGTFRAQRC